MNTETLPEERQEKQFVELTFSAIGLGKITVEKYKQQGFVISGENDHFDSPLFIHSVSACLCSE